MADRLRSGTKMEVKDMDGGQGRGMCDLLHSGVDVLSYGCEKRFSGEPGIKGRIVRSLVPGRVRRLTLLENYHEGEDCFIIGNGPSLNQTDLGLLKGKHCIGLNKIFLMFRRQEFELSYLVSVNPLVIEQSLTEWSKMTTTTFLPVHLCRKEGDRSANFRLIRVGDRFNFNKRMAGNFGQGHTVTYVAMQLAFAMGFQRIFLVGVDHFFKQVGTANEAQKMEGGDENHFDPDYFGGQLWHLADLEASEISYRIAEMEFRRSGRVIYDATVNGKLDIFEKMKFADAVSAAKDKVRASQ